MHRYKIFLISGETVEVKAEKVLSIIDDSGDVYRSDFVETDTKGILKRNASIYNNTIKGWAELPESEDDPCDKCEVGNPCLYCRYEFKSKTGYWIMHQDHRECSECGIYFLKDMPRNSYCPNCGARMTESEEVEK